MGVCLVIEPILACHHQGKTEQPCPRIWCHAQALMDVAEPPSVVYRLPFMLGPFFGPQTNISSGSKKRSHVNSTRLITLVEDALRIPRLAKSLHSSR